jgi:class 3 adenylate cyclase/energy-coupling factor transporter ATP-binding protein EcfA2
VGDLAEWLGGLGLGKYAAAFAEQEIEFDHLPLLTEADVRDLGLPIGPRRKLLEAIEALRDGHPSRREPPKRQGEAERRQLTVMFVDLAESTPLALRLDPEAMSDVLRAFQNTVAGEIGRLGFVAKLMGDGVLAYFGWPRAHEDDARRAVAAALAIVDAVARLPSPAGDQLACRIGIATGLVVVGDLVGEGAAQEHAVVGATPNLAARLQEAAGPGEVMIADSTRRLLGADFALEDIGERRLKGHEQAVPLFRVLRREARESRFAARGEASSAPLVGRDAELALLLRAWGKARSGRGQAVLLTGEAGIGKSRLLQALSEAIAAEQPTRHVFQCSPLHDDNPFWPVVLRFAPAAAIVARGPEDGGGGDRRQVRRDAVAALAALLLAAARGAPALVVFEDAQWADQATLELMRHLAGAVGDAPVLLIVTGRPEAESRFGTAANPTRLELPRFDGPTAVALIAAVAGRYQLAPRLLGDILARGDGVPLFLEEMTKAVIETAPAGAAVSAPATLRDSLIARLDVAPAMKAVAQIASCIGRDFDEALLTTVGDIGAVEQRQGLAALLQAGLVVAHAGGGFRFKQALLCDIAYESLLTPRRQRLHRSIAEALEAMPDAPAEREPELLARHWYAAGENGRAEVYWLRARHRAAHWQEQLDALADFLDSDAAEVIPLHNRPDRRRQG